MQDFVRIYPENNGQTKANIPCKVTVDHLNRQKTRLKPVVKPEKRWFQADLCMPPTRQT
jgi:hypothetical protein